MDRDYFELLGDLEPHGLRHALSPSEPRQYHRNLRGFLARLDAAWLDDALHELQFLGP